MSYDFVQWGFKFCLFFWFPFSIVAMIFLLRRMFRKWAPSLKNEKYSSVNGIATKAFIRSIPALLVFIVLQVPLFYFAKQSKQYNYCMDVVSLNRLSDIKNSDLQERCSQFDLVELMKRAQNEHKR